MILFRTNGGQEGLGHINRIFSLYNKMREIKADINCLFFVNPEAKRVLMEKGISQNSISVTESYHLKEIDKFKQINPELLIMDTYKAGNDYINRLRKEKIKTALFIDTLEYANIEVEILINGNIYADSDAYKKELEKHSINYHKGLFGTDYLILNPSFKKTKICSNKQKQLTITTGGSDPNDYMPLLMNKIKLKGYTRNIIIGPFFSSQQIKKIEQNKKTQDKLFYAPKSLNEIIAKTDLMVSSAGSTVYEILYHKKPFALFETGTDQRMIINYFREKGIIIINPDNADNHLDTQINQLLEPEYKAKFNSFKELTKKSTSNLAQNMLKEIYNET